QIKDYAFRSQREVVRASFDQFLVMIESLLLSSLTPSGDILKEVAENIKAFLVLTEPAKEIQEEAKQMLLDFCQAINKKIDGLGFGYETDDKVKFKQIICDSIIQSILSKLQVQLIISNEAESSEVQSKLKA